MYFLSVFICVHLWLKTSVAKQGTGGTMSPEELDRLICARAALTAALELAAQAAQQLRALEKTALASHAERGTAVSAAIVSNAARWLEETQEIVRENYHAPAGS